MHQREPTLDDLLNEPIIRQAMVADGYGPDDVRLLMRQAGIRASRTGAKLLFDAADTRYIKSCYFAGAGSTSCCSLPS